MRVFMISMALLLASIAALALPAEAGKRRGAQTWQQAAPVKDCTRLNGRFGYYGNPWCTRAEQDAWDRATARRAR